LVERERCTFRVIGYVPPVEYQDACYRAQEAQATERYSIN